MNLRPTVWGSKVIVEFADNQITIPVKGLAAAEGYFRNWNGDESKAWIDFIDWPELSGWYPREALEVEI